LIRTMEASIMPNHNREALQGLFSRLYREIGYELGNHIIKTIFDELGGLRITIPSVKVLYREERNKLIIKKFNGINHKELALLFDLSEQQVRRILREA